MIHKKRFISKNIKMLSFAIILLISITAVSYGDVGNKNVSINAENAVVYCENTGTVVFEKNSNIKNDPGEVTKIMTALVAAQKLPLDRDVKVPKKALGGDNNLLDLKEGEVISVEDLLYGVLMLGSNDAAITLGESTYGNIDNFVKKMNSTAKNIGCKNVHFLNVTGGLVKAQKVTAKDYLKILRVAFSNRIIYKIGMAESHSFSRTNKHGKRLLKKNNIIKSKAMYFSGWMGNDTSRQTQVAANIFNNGMQLHVVLLGENGLKLKEDIEKLLTYAKSRLDGYKVISEGKEVGKARVKHGEKTRITAYASIDGYAYLPKEGSKSLIRTETVMKADLQAPIKTGDTIGYYYIYVGEEVVNKVPLVSKEGVDIGWFPSYVGISNITTVIILLLLGILLIAFLWGMSVRAKAIRKKKRIRKRKLQRIVEEQMREEEEQRKRGWKY